MMWLVPAVLAIAAVIPIMIAARRFAGEAIALRREIVRFSELRPALLELRADAGAVRQAAAVTSRRLPRR